MPTNERTDRVSYRVMEFQWSATISFIKFGYSNTNFTELVGFVEMIRKVKKHPYWIQQCFFHFDSGMRKIRVVVIRVFVPVRVREWFVRLEWRQEDTQRAERDYDE